MQVTRSANSFESLFIFFVATLFLLGCGGGGGGGSVKTPPKTPPAVSLSSLELGKSETKLKISETVQIMVTGTYSDGSNKDLTSVVSWTVSNPTIIEVSNTGLITALATGSSTVTATYDGKSVEGNITVIDLVDLSISPTTLTLPIQTRKQLSVTGRYTDDSSESLDHLVTWESSNTEIASISDTGEVLALSAGSVTISAVLGSINTSLIVTVSPSNLRAIIVSSNSTQIPIGLTGSYTAKGIYSDGSEQDLSNQVLWSVSDSSIATINPETGLLTALKKGKLSIIARKEGQTGVLIGTVSDATLQGIAITPLQISLAKGSKIAVSVTANFSDNSKIDVSEQVTWTNSNEEVARIESNPITIVSLKEGSATLTATLNEQQAEVLINVTNAELLSLVVYPVNASIPLRQSQQYYAQGIYSDDSVHDLTSEVTWISSNENQAIISNAKSFAGLAESKALGNTTIKAVMGEISQETTLTVSNAQLNHIEIVPTTLKLPKDSNTSIKALGYFSDGSLIDLTTKVIWTSSNAAGVDVRSAKQGLLHSLNKGTALLSATLEGVVGLANITITDSTLQSISISAPRSTLPEGMSQRLIATGIYSDMSSRDISQHVNWQSDDILIASVTNSANAGIVQGISPGQVTITASLGEISNDSSFNVTDAQLTNIEITAPKPEINVQSTLLATAVASFSDASTMDVSSQVNWSSSDVNVASISNMDIVAKKGLVTGLSSGTVNLSASLMGVRSNNVSMKVGLDPHLPKRVILSVQPNIILNNNNDPSQVKLVLVPSLENGIIADGTPITLKITEGENSRDIILNTKNGEVTYTLESEYDGFISLSAEFSDYSVNSGLASADNFNIGISTTGRAYVIFENNSPKPGSAFYALLRNLTNRSFNLNQINVGYLDPNNNNAFVDFPDSPLTSGEFTSDGSLTAGESTFLGYEVEVDVETNVYFITYEFFEEKTSTLFKINGAFNTDQ